MDNIQAPLSISISELKRNPSAIIDAARGRTIAVLNHNRPTAYLVPVGTYEALMEHNKVQNNTFLADFVSSLPVASSFPIDAVAAQQSLRNEW